MSSTGTPSRRRIARSIPIALIGLVALAATVVTACSSAPTATPTAAAAAEGEAPAAAQKLIVGALHVGAVNDNGYNQAMHEGLLEMQENVPGVEVIEASLTELYDPSRNPGASHHNLFGLRPTKGLSSIDGIIPFRVYTKSDPTGGPRATLRLP